MGRKAALGGILTAISLIFLYFAFYLPSLKLTMYFLAGIIPGITLIEIGVTQAWILYAATSLLAFFTLGNTVKIVPYILIFGIYPIIKYYIEKISKFSIQIILKLIFFNLAIGMIYMIWTKLFMVNMVLFLPLKWFIIAIQPAFLFYDYVFTRIIFYYFDRIRAKWRKD